MTGPAQRLAARPVLSLTERPSEERDAAAMKPTQTPTPTPASDPMRPSALLRGAAAYLRYYGWTTGQFYDLLADSDGPFTPACTSGAIITAATGRCPTSGIFTDGDDDSDTDAAIRAMRALAAYLDPCYGTDAYTPSAIDVIGDWNDEKGRTLDEVIETLTDAAHDWETAHPTGGAR